MQATHKQKGDAMASLRVIVVSAEEAADGNAELWLGNEQMAVTFLYDGRLHLRIDPRRDGEPWLIDTTSLALALENAVHELAAY
jgi:hypothetical protein